MSVRIKICGLTNAADALCAAQAGADYLGFILFPKSPRYVAPALIRDIIQELRAAGFPTPGIGVFVNTLPEQVAEILAQTGLDFAQLHGDEPPPVLQTLAPRAFKALRPTDASQAVADGRRYHTPTHHDGPRLFVDAYDPAAYGGTGKRADRLVAAQLAQTFTHLLLAGGLTPDNVAQAVIDIEPWGVDVSSGIETAPGRKDHQAIARFIAAARRA